MRGTADRIRHALLFEIIGLILLIGGGWVLLGMPPETLGVVGVVSSVVAMVWNYLYNLGFDHLMLGLRGTTEKTQVIRVGHAVLFELTLLVLLLPFVAWYMGLSLWGAFLLDMGIATFYVAYAYGFNWAYDRVFPVPRLA